MPDPTSPGLSAYGRASLTASPVNRMMAEYAATFRDDVDINLGVGYVNEATIPRDDVRRGLAAVLADPVRYRAALNYGGPHGSDNLIHAVRRWYLQYGPGGVGADLLDARRLLIGPNGATSLLESLALLLQRGIVVVADPLYYIYCDVLQRAGFELLPVPEDEEGLSADHLRQALGDLGERCARITFVYIVTVHNPTATVMSNQRRREIVQIVTDLSARLGRPVPLIADRAYEDLVHGDVERPRSMLADDEAGIVYEVGSLSKIIAPALRIGYLIAPPGPLIGALVQRTSDAGFSASLLNQEISAWLLQHTAAAQIRAVRDGYRHKAGIVGAWIEQRLGPFLAQVRGGKAGFYYYLTFDGIDTCIDSPFHRYLSRRTHDPHLDGPAGDPRPRVVYIPGLFCVHPQGQMAAVGRCQLRLSYGFEELHRIDAGIRFMAEACAWARARA